MRTASASSVARYTCATGPKNSSFEAGFSGVTSVSTVVWKNAPSRVPPCTSVAPCSIARLTCSSRPSAAFSEDSGPRAESADVGSVASISAIFAVNFSRKGSYSSSATMKRLAALHDWPLLSRRAAAPGRPAGGGGGAGREARVEEDLLHRGGGLGALRGMLEQDRVAYDEVRAGEAGDLVVREVPRHDAEQHPERRAGGGPPATPPR